MKSKLIISIILISCSALFLFAGCASDIKTFKGKINDIDGTTVYITPNDDENLPDKNILINIKNKKIKLDVDDNVIVTYTGAIKEKGSSVINLKYIEKIQE